MHAIFAALIALSAGIAAYARGRREGTWSWRRFLLVAGFLTLIGGGIGAAVAAIGRRWGPEGAIPLTIAAALAIVACVTIIALVLRRRGG